MSEWQKFWVNYPLLGGVALKQPRAAQCADNNWIPELSSSAAWPKTSGFTHTRTHTQDQQVDLINILSQENSKGKNRDHIFLISKMILLLLFRIHYLTF